MEHSPMLNDENSRDTGVKNVSASPATGSSVNNGGLSSENSENNYNSQTVALSSIPLLPIDENTKKTSSQDFAEQIRKLEIEGNKLRAITANSLLGTGTVNGFSFENSFEFPRPQSSTPLGCLSSFVDTSFDPKYIADLRNQLDSQRKETDHLTKQLLSDSFSYHTVPRSSHGSHQFQTQTKSAFSTYPSQTLNRKSLDSLPSSHLEKSLKDSQEQIIELRKKLQEVTDSSDQQKRQFRQTVEDLKSKLHETIHNRDAVLDLRQKESNSQELLIHKLQSALTQLQDHNKLQEEALMSASKQLDSMKHVNEMNETALSQISCILLTREKGHGHTYFKSDLINGQNTSILVHTLERCLRDLDNDIVTKSKRLTELESELDVIKKNLSERERNIARDYQEMIRKEKDDSIKKFTMLTAEHEKNVSSVNEMLLNANQQIASLKSQLQQEEDCYIEKLKSKERQLREMEENVIELKTENMKNTASWQEKLIQAKHEQVYTETLRQALETSLDQVQKELVEVKAEKTELIQSLSVAETRLDDLQNLVAQLEGDLDTERDRVQQQRQREEELRSDLMSLELQVSNKQGDIDRLERTLDMVKQEYSLQVLEKQNLLSTTEKLEREQYIDQIKHLSSQLATMTEKYNKSTMELQTSYNDIERLKSDASSLTRTLEKARSQAEKAEEEKAELAMLLNEKTDQMDRVARDKVDQAERLLRDKDQYVKLVDQRSEEVSQLKLSLETMKVQLEEKEKVLDTLRQQSSSIAQLMEIHTKASDSVREEKEKLVATAAEKELVLHDMRMTVESLTNQMKTQDDRVKGLEEENLKVNKNLQQKSQELVTCQEEKKTLLSELTQVKADLEALTIKKDALKKEVIKAKTLHTKEIAKLQTKLKESEQEKRMSAKALRSKDIIDNKAVRYADKIQKEMTVKRSELDQLTTKLHRMEEKLETVSREKSLVEKDKDSLKKSLAKSLLHSQELSNKVESVMAQNGDLLAQLSLMEKDFELRSSTYQAKMETFEQEIAKLKLKHQLDLKEVEGMSRCKTGSLSTACHKSSSLPSSVSSVKQKMATSDSGDLTDSSESDSPLTKHSKRTFYTTKTKNTFEVGKDLKLLLGEMKTLVSESREAAAEYLPRDKTEKSRRNKMNAALHSQNLSPTVNLISNTEKSKMSPARSLTSLADLSDGLAYKGAGNFLVSDTQELCRRLEEKIENLTKMGGNLIKENQDMADLINLQGEKINTVKQKEKITW
ncbi:coiled-coil domain-containing protein 158 [Biomphalaria pfeifferi]|uniref:Coiled-coil domain-containing protein 158 n=1 Tax=Biomphalaria pfeifferi TaxID=112525 RepID=A0AAD8BTL3_BIOPF|nr:coiled-coil domain-containing protein 158 [Biomphalaria pfeifferi]